MTTTKKVFQEVANQLRQQIAKGVYQPGQKLPSEYELATLFQVSRLTIRKALALLMDEHLLAKEPGKGTYVMKPSKVASGAGGLQSFTEKARQEGRMPMTKVLACEVATELPQSVAVFFGDQEELIVPVWRIQRLRFWEDEPMTLEEQYVPQRFLPEISKELLQGSLFEALEKQVEIGYSHQEVEAVLADEEKSRLLAVTVGAPLLLVHSLTYSPAGIPVLYDTSYYRGDKYTFRNTLQRKRYR